MQKTSYLSVGNTDDQTIATALRVETALPLSGSYRLRVYDSRLVHDQSANFAFNQPAPGRYAR